MKVQNWWSWFSWLWYHARLGYNGHQDRQEKQDNHDKRDRQDRQIWHLNSTFQVTCVGQLSQFLRCFHLFKHQRFADDDGNDDDNFSKDANADEITIILLNMLSTIGRRSDSTLRIFSEKGIPPPHPSPFVDFFCKFVFAELPCCASFIYILGFVMKHSRQW